MESTTPSDTTKAGEALIVKQLPRKRQNRVRSHGAGSIDEFHGLCRLRDDNEGFY